MPMYKMLNHDITENGGKKDRKLNYKLCQNTVMQQSNRQSDIVNGDVACVYKLKALGDYSAGGRTVSCLLDR